MLQSWISIPVRTVNYNTDTNNLNINFDYNADIDLNTKYFQIDPSSSTSSSYQQYFYETPVVSVALSQPFNNL